MAQGGKVYLFSLPNTRLATPTMYYGLGSLYIGAALKRYGMDVKLIDLRNSHAFPAKEFFEGIETNSVAAFSCTTPEINFAKKLSRLARSYGIYTVVGGPHPTLLPEDCVNDFNLVFRGEGDIISPRLIEQRTEGVVESRRLHDLTMIPLPAWDLYEHPFTDTIFYGERCGHGALGATVITSRGCPFNCGFCANIYRAPVVYNSTGTVLRELIELKKRGVTQVRFVDDNFTMRPNLPDACEVLKELDINFRCQMRADAVKEETIQMLKDSGCKQINLGVESTDPNILKIARKHESVEDYVKAIRSIKKVGIAAHVLLMMGMPGENDRSVTMLKSFMRQTKPEGWTLATLTPYPGCDMWNDSEKYEIKIINKDFSNYWNFCEESYNHVLNGQTKDQMWKRYQEVYQWLTNKEYLK